MSPCPICGKSVKSTKYMDVIEVPVRGSVKLGHIECCPTNVLRKYLETRSHTEIEFFHDALELAGDTKMSRIESFERRYGSYGEISQNTRLDSWLTIMAVVAELKKRTK